jgi:hypothetical protein
MSTKNVFLERVPQFAERVLHAKAMKGKYPWSIPVLSHLRMQAVHHTTGPVSDHLERENTFMRYKVVISLRQIHCRKVSDATRQIHRGRRSASRDALSDDPRNHRDCLLFVISDALTARHLTLVELGEWSAQQSRPLNKTAYNGDIKTANHLCLSLRSVTTEQEYRIGDTIFHDEGNGFFRLENGPDTRYSPIAERSGLNVLDMTANGADYSLWLQITVLDTAFEQWTRSY